MAFAPMTETDEVLRDEWFDDDTKRAVATPTTALGSICWPGATRSPTQSVTQTRAGSWRAASSALRGWE